MIKNLDKTNILHKTTQESDDKQSDDLLKSTIKIQKYFRTYTKNLKEAIINEIYDNTNNPNIITEIHEINSYKIEKNNTNKDKSNSKYFASYTITPNYTKDRHKNLTINNNKELKYDFIENLVLDTKIGFPKATRS